ncbi:uncharacterized protein LOC126741383 [Anthonomus grandis grandis]|uniref:uncharacterized protein LOC126741383 n=1 Tax=Anthonomus grandis grandis TaxID=2921223 RepID=UPI002165F860|nr:uncharacterized protein LOC126741383 [Anthonomus grandis grandis]
MCITFALRIWVAFLCLKVACSRISHKLSMRSPALVKFSKELDLDDVEYEASFRKETLCSQKEMGETVYKPVPIALPWRLSYHFCTKRNLTLVAIRTADEQKYLKNELLNYQRHVPTNSLEAKHYKETLVEGPKVFWTSGTSIGKKRKGNFFWFPQMPMHYTNWGPELGSILKIPPGTDIYGPISGEKCIYVNAREAYRSPFGSWYSTFCGMKLPFVCQHKC